MKKWFALLICALLIMMACAAFAETTVYEPIEYTVTDTGADSETLFERYVDALFTGKRARMVTGNRLTGIEATIYQALAKQVVAVAEGSLSSTVFEFPVEEIFPVTRWTQEDLGTEIIVNGGISSEAMEKVRSSISYDISLVNRALLADYPYEMYWYDKTSGCTVSGYGYSSNGEELWITGTVTFSYTVAGEFAAGTYAVNSTPALTAQIAAENAKAIVRKYASLSDYEKLAAYKQEICDLVDYNHDAVDNGAPYGNPWQLIWVFDGDPATKVVCEGYSKAFQYLCDMSTFSSGTDCYTVSGVMGGGTGAGRHMWNIVAMDDGRRYLVDITNSDAGSVGQNGGLFLNAFDSLDMTQGYTYQCENGAVSYIYDEAMLSLFTDAELAMSADDYDPNHEPVYTPSPEPMITETPTPTATPEPEWSTPTPYWDDPTPTPLWEEPTVEPTEMPTPVPMETPIPTPTPEPTPTPTPYPTLFFDDSVQEFTIYMPTVEGHDDVYKLINGGDDDRSTTDRLFSIIANYYDPMDKTQNCEL
ncbi:MAG: hypothetical protein IJ234_05855, partial [Clostridia bacterium]|nr:hypothetical protein [Clostridia bacterium]